MESTKTNPHDPEQSLRRILIPIKHIRPSIRLSNHHIECMYVRQTYLFADYAFRGQAEIFEFHNLMNLGTELSSLVIACGITMVGGARKDGMHP